MKPTEGRYIAKRYGAVSLRLQSGEHLPVLIHLNTGVPPTIALRFGMRERHRGSSARLLVILRRVAELYDWFAQVGEPDLDELLMRGDLPSSEQFTRALDDVQKSQGRALRNEPRLRNRRVAAWSVFAEYLGRPALWRTGLSINEGHELRKRFAQNVQAILDDLSAERRSIVESAHHEPLTSAELGAIEAVLDPNSDLCPFASSVLDRNRLMVHLARYGALRLGEILNITIDSLQQSGTTAERLVRELVGAPRALNIERRPDDPDDPRRVEPRVKRHGRMVDLPDFVASEFDSYVAQTNRRHRQKYLILTDDQTRPLSASRADKIARTLGTAAARSLRAQHPAVGNSLTALNWHRFRTTRAIELLPIFFEDLQWNPIDEDAYLAHFGWSDRKYAAPYLSTLWRADGNRRLREAHRDLKP